MNKSEKYAAIREYNKRNYKRFSVCLKKDTSARVTAYREKHNLSCPQFLTAAIDALETQEKGT